MTEKKESTRFSFKAQQKKAEQEKVHYDKFSWKPEDVVFEKEPKKKK